MVGGGGYTYAEFPITDDEIYGYFQIRIVTAATGSGLECFTFSVTGVSDQFLIIPTTDGAWIIQHGGVSSSSGGSVVNGTTYHVWFRYKAVVGMADGIGQLWVSTTSTKPGSVTCEVTNGTGTAAANVISPRARNSTEFVFDRILLDDVAIGSAP